MAKLITSQHFLDDEIIASKLASADFEVSVSPEFEVNGEVFRVILDGNHSFAAALQAGIDPNLIEADATAHDAVAMIDRGEIEDFLQALWMDGDYIDAATRQSAF